MSGDAPRLAGPAGLTLVAVALTAAMAAPVLLHPASRLFGSELVGRHAAPFIVISQLERPRPLGPFTQPATDWTGAALARLVGDPVVAFNLLVLASFPLAALFAYLLAWELSRSRLAAWVAGLAFAFAPFHLAQAAYHPHGAQVQWLPLYFLALWRSADRAEPRRIALLVAAAVLVALSSFYYGLMAVVLTPVALLGWWIAAGPAGRARAGRAPAATLATLGALALAGLGYVAVSAAPLLAGPSRFAWPKEDLLLYSARWWSYLVPPLGHPVYGPLAEAFWRDRHPGGVLEQQLALGPALLLLAAVAVAARLGPRSGGGRPREAGLAWVPALLLLGAGALLCSLSPVWRLGPVELPRPSAALYAVAPMFRAYARFGVVVALAAALLAGIGAAALARRVGRRAAAAPDARARGAGLRPLAQLGLLGLLGLLAIDVAPFPPWRWRDVLPTAAHRWLSGRPGVRALDCVPETDAAARSAERFFDGEILFLRGAEDCGDPGLPAVLAGRGVTHLIVRGGSPLASLLAAGLHPPGLAPGRAFPDARLLAVEAEPATVEIVFGPGFSWREYKGAESYRWMGSRGTLWLTVTGEQPRAIVLELTLAAFPGRRQVEVRLDGAPHGRVDVGPEPGPHRLAPLALAPGRHRLELRALNPAVVADDVLGNGDRRALAVALWGWRLSPAPDEG